MRDYFYHKHLPEIFGADTLLNVVNFVLGCHPASNTSYISGVRHQVAVNGLWLQPRRLDVHS
jgi:hypothetical protein